MKKLIVLALLLMQAKNMVAQVIDEIGQAVVDEVYTAPQGIQVFKQNGLSGIKDYSTNEILVPAEYIRITEEMQDNFVLTKKYSEVANIKGLYNLTLKKMVLPVGFEHITFDMVEGNDDPKNNTGFVIVVRKGSREGLLDHNYKFLYPLEYDKIDTRRTHVLLEKDGKTGVDFFDEKKPDIPLVYDQLYPVVSTRFLIAIRDNSYSLFDDTGKLISGENKRMEEHHSRWRNTARDNFLIVDKNNKCGIFDMKAGNYILPVIYESILDVFKDQFIVRKDSKFGLVTPGNKTVVPFHYDTLAFLNPKDRNPLLLASRNKQCGMITMENRTVTGFSYDAIENIGGYYKFKKAGKYTVADSLGNRISATAFDDVGSFYNGQCAVFKGGKIGYMDASGNMKEPFKRPSPARGYKDLRKLYEGFVTALKSENEATILQFCRDAVYDDYSKEFFLRTRLQHRGFPNTIVQGNTTIEKVVQEYYREVLSYYQRVKEAGQLQSLEFTGFSKEDYAYYSQEVKLWGTRAEGVFRSKDRERLKCNLGELVVVDGYWKTFTTFSYYFPRN